MSCITITFGDCSENHVGMQKNGKLSDKGYNSEDLDKISKIFEEKEIERINLVTFLENENYNWQNGRQITSIFSKIKITLFKTFKEIFYLRNKKKHNSELHIYLENLVNEKKGN